jgi:AraC-like DNA-binding protein
MNDLNIPFPDDEFYRKLNPWVFKVGYCPAKPGWISEDQDDTKTYFDLWYITNGDGEVKIDGRWYPFTQGDVVTIFPGEDYQQERGAFGTYFIFVHPFSRRNRNLDSRLARNWPCILPLQNYPILKDYFADIFETFTAKPDGYPLTLKAAALQVFRMVLSLLPRKEEASFPPAFAGVLAAQRYIEARYAESVSLETIAEAANVSASYLSVLFHRYFHTSPVEYLIEVRLRAARLLLAKGTSVSQTARQAGFGSLHYFSRVFKSRQGMSPTQFIRSCQSRRGK